MTKHYYPLDGNASDASGNNRHGTIYGGVTPTSDVGGASGKAMAFNGTDGYIEVNQSVIPTSGDFTVAFWGKGHRNLPGMEGVSQISGPDGANFYIGRVGDTMRAGDDWHTVNGVAFPYDYWHHFAVVKSTGYTFLYIDGVLKSIKYQITNPFGISIAQPDSIRNPTGNVFRIGRQYGTDMEWWKGAIDEVCVYNRFLLNDEIKSLAAQPPPGPTPTTRIDGIGFYVYADSITRDSMNDYIATGNVSIGKVMNPPEPVLRYMDGTLKVTSDGKTFKSVNNQGTLYAWQVRRKASGDTPFNAPLFKGNFEGSSNISNELSIKLEVSAESEKILWQEKDGFAELKAKVTTASLIKVNPESVEITGCKQDFALKNPLISFADFGGVTSEVTNIFSRNMYETTSKTTFSIGIGRLGSYELLDFGATIDLINWGLELHAGGLAFGALTGAASGKLFNFSSKQFPQLKATDVPFQKLNGFAIGAQINPPAITRFTVELAIPTDIASQLTVPHASYSGIPIGIAPKTVGFDVKNLSFFVPGSISASLSGAVYDNANALATLEKILFASFISGKIMGTLDLSGTVALGGNIKILYWDMAKFYGHLSRYAPQIKAAGSITLNIPAIPGIDLLYVTADVGVDGYISGNTIGFGGYSKLTFTPSWVIATVMSLLKICSGDCAIAGVNGSVSGSLDTYGNASLKLYSEAFFNFPYLGCTCECWKFWCWEFLTGKYKVWISATLLPRLGGELGAGKTKRDLPESEPGIDRYITQVQLANGEMADALVEFNYGRPLAVFSGDGRRSPTVSENTVIMDKAYDYATIVVKGQSGKPQLKVTTPPILDENGNIRTTDDQGNPIVYEYSSANANTENAVVIFDSEAADHSIVAIVKGTVPGDYKLEILNPAEVGTYTIEVTVPNQPPQFEIKSAQIVEQKETQDIVEVSYTLTDEDSANPYVTFRLDEKSGTDNSETALYLFPKNADTSNFENTKIYGKSAEPKTVQLVIDRSKLKADSYKLYGRAEDGSTAPVVQWTELNDMLLKMPGVPEPPENIKATVNASGVLLEWNARPTTEKVGAYHIWIDNVNNPEEWHDIWIDVENPDAAVMAHEIFGLRNGETYSTEIYSVNTEAFEYSFSSDPITVAPTGMTASGSPDLVIDMENTWVERNVWDSDVTMTITVKNVGTAASESALLEIFYGKLDPAFAVTKESEGMLPQIDPILPNSSKQYELTFSQELLDSLTKDARYAVDYPCYFRIISTNPKELNTDNNTGMVEKIEEPYVEERTLTLRKGWNLIGLPVDSIVSAYPDPDSDYTYRLLFGDATIWQYWDEEWLGYGPHLSEDDPMLLAYLFGSDGFWLYSTEEKTINMKGWTYQTDTDWVFEDIWNLMGTGEPIDNPLSYFQVVKRQEGVKAVWVLGADGQWIKNPVRIEAGQGYWISYSDTEEPPERPKFQGLAEVLLILKLTVGIPAPGYPVMELDLTGNGIVGLEDVIFGLQKAAEMR